MPIHMTTLITMLAHEERASKAYDKMTPAEKQAYLRAHPNSKYGRHGGGKGVTTEMHDTADRLGWKENVRDSDYTEMLHPRHRSGRLYIRHDGKHWDYQNERPGKDSDAKGRSAKGLHRHLSQLLS